MSIRTIDYLQNFGGNQELLYVVDPTQELTNYHTAKVVFTGENFQGLSDELRMELNAILKEHFTQIPEDQIQVVSLVQGTGTKNPKITDYTFEVTTYQVDILDTPNEVYVLGSLGMQKKLHTVAGPVALSLKIKSSIPNLSEGIISAIREKIFGEK